MTKIKEIILKYKAYIICVVIIIMSIISIIMQDMDRKNTLKVNDKELENKDGKIAVYISGAVKNPGVYYLDNNSRLYNLLDICGGVNDNADISKLNLAQKLVDSDKFEVPIKIDNKEEEIENEEIIEEDKSSDKVNINTASSEELQTLNGIGKSTAKKIIDYRKDNQFDNIEDIMEVPGIGESKFNNIKDSICTK